MVTTMSHKGQIVIPAVLRERYNIAAGDKLELVDIGGEIVIIPITVKNPVDEAKGILKGGRTTRQIMREIKEEERKYENKKK